MKDKIIIPATKLFDSLLITFIGVVIYFVLSTPNKKQHKERYTITVTKEGTYVQDGKRPVGFLPFTNSALDSLIINDNK